MQRDKLFENLNSSSGCDEPPVALLEVKSSGSIILINALDVSTQKIVYGFSSTDMRPRFFNLQKILDEADKVHEEVRNDLRFHATQPLSVYLSVALEMGMTAETMDENAVEFKSIVKRLTQESRRP